MLSAASGRRAEAYTISTTITDGCHERITAEALRRVRAQSALAIRIAPDDDEQALIDDLQFEPDGDMLDLGAVALLIGVRDNDLKGHAADDLASLPEVHGNPEAQDEHCLRATDQNEPDGSALALEACRKYILGRISAALDGLDESGIPDPEKRATLLVHLAVRGGVRVPLPMFYVHMGQAMHALEDGFSHTYRTADAMRVVTVLNWVDVVGARWDEARDGPAHSSALDECNDADDARRIRREVTTDAAEELLLATLTPGTTKAERLENAARVLDKYLSLAPGCDPSNAWCEAPEAGYDVGCDVAGDASSAANTPLLAAVIAGLALARGRRRSRTRRGALSAAAPLAFAVLSASRSAHADEPAKPTSEATKEAPAKKVTRTREDDLRWGGALTGGVSIDEPGLAFAAGVRLHYDRLWSAGIDAEWNPWVSLIGGEAVRSGVFNIYFSSILRFPLAKPKLFLRSTISVGSSTMLSALYGAPRGTTGLFFGVNFLGLEFAASDVVKVVFNPLGVAVPAPQLSGVPFLYPQYRLSVSAEFYGP
ncbi:MAG: hypothetical protein U0271_32090 [Polyangiaceae bacterium]